MGTLDGKVAFITGAARGQGQAHCVKLAEEGADIIAVDVLEEVAGAVYPLATREDMDETVRRVEALGRRIIASKVDVRDQSALDGAVADGVTEFGRLDVVSANAGISTTKGKLWEIDDEAWNSGIDVNLTGVWRTIKATVPAMIECGNGGSVILTSSLAGLKGYQNIGTYVAAKHGVNGLVKVLANEVGQYGIRANSVCPGLINTDMMMNQAVYDVFRPEIDNPTQEDATQVFRTMQVLPIDWLEPRDVSEAVAWLASDASRYITGVELKVDGGQVGR